MRGKIWWLGALVCAAALKVWFLWMDVVPFNADEGIVALMARHILQGERPIFYYGQAYMGSLDAGLVAMGFALFGQHVWVIRMVQILLYLCTLVTTAILGEKAFGSRQTGILAAWLLAIPVVNVSLYTTVSWGGYGETLLLGNLILIETLRIARIVNLEGRVNTLDWFIWGFLVGLGLWVFGLTLVYSLPAALYLVWQARSLLWLRKPLVITLIGGLVGSAPWWYYLVKQGTAAPLGELSGSAIAGVEGLSYLSQIWQHFTSLLLLGTTVTIGMRPPWGVTWLGLPLLPIALLFWLTVLLHLFRRPATDRRVDGGLLLSGVILTLVLAFIFTPFGADPSGRYFIPLAIPLALFAADWIWSLRERSQNQYISHWFWAPAALVLAFNLWGNLQSALNYPPGLTTQFSSVTQIDQRYMPELIAFLRQHGELRGYTNFWVAYPLAFLSGEELVYVPRLPYHTDFRYTSRDDRYLAYTSLVTEADRVAYITTRHPKLDQALQERFSNLGATWKEVWIGDFHVFYALSRPVRPEEIGLGVTTP